MVILLLVITALLWGITPILEKIGLGRTDPLVGVTLRSTIVSVGLLALTLIMGKGRALLEVDAKSVLLFGLSGVLAGILAMWTYYAALKMEATSRIVPIAASYPLVTAFLSAFVLKEGMTPSRMIGTGFIVFGIWLVK